MEQRRWRTRGGEELESIREEGAAVKSWEEGRGGVKETPALVRMGE